MDSKRMFSFVEFSSEKEAESAYVSLWSDSNSRFSRFPLVDSSVVSVCNSMGELVSVCGIAGCCADMLKTGSF